MKYRLLNKVFPIISVILLFSSCNPPPDLSSFDEHPAVHLLVSTAKLKPNSGVWSMDWSTPSMLTLLVSTRDAQWPMYISDVHTGNLISVIRNGKELWTPNAKLSPGGNYLAYRIMEEHLGTYIATLDKQSGASFGLKDEHLIINTDRTNCLDWSHDGQQLAILTMVEDNVILYIYDLSGRNIQKSLVYNEAHIESIENLSWSPDGNKLAFSLKYVIEKKNTYDVQYDVFVYHIDENRLVRLTSSPKISEESPSWFPKGDVLIYTSTRDGDSRMLDSRLVFSTSDGKCTKVVPRLEGIQSPSWSPDGTQIAFISGDGVEIMDVAQVIPSEFLTLSGLCN